MIYREINKLNEKYIIQDNKELIFEEKNENKEEEKNIQNKEEAKPIIEENKSINTSNEKITSEIKNIDFIYIEASEDSWIEIQDKNTKVIVSKIIKKEEKIKLPYQKDLEV